MKTQAKKAPAPKLSNTEQLAYELEALKHRLTRQVAESQAAVEKLTAAMKSPFYAIDRFEWLGSYATGIVEGALAERVLAIADPKNADKDEVEPRSLEAAAQAVLNMETEALMRDQYRGSSTSAFHNATQDARREAASRFCGDFGVRRYLERITELKQKIAAERHAA